VAAAKADVDMPLPRFEARIHESERWKRHGSARRQLAELVFFHKSWFHFPFHLDFEGAVLTHLPGSGRQKDVTWTGQTSSDNPGGSIDTLSSVEHHLRELQYPCRTVAQTNLFVLAIIDHARIKFCPHPSIHQDGFFQTQLDVCHVGDVVSRAS
jgi:hypothetical protein